MYVSYVSYCLRIFGSIKGRFFFKIVICSMKIVYIRVLLYIHTTCSCVLVMVDLFTSYVFSVGSLFYVKVLYVCTVLEVCSYYLSVTRCEERTTSTLYVELSDART